MTDAFIERRFELGENAEVIVRFGRPVRDTQDFYCEYEIEWPDRKERHRAFGIDQVQALLLALKIAHAMLVSSPEGKRGELRWLGTDDLGLPTSDLDPPAGPG